jgi:hypothetical protein
MCDLPHVGIHHGTDAFAGGEEIFRDIYFSIHISLGNPFAVLVGEGKSMYIIEYGHLHLDKAGNIFGQGKIEPDEKQDEKADEKSDFFLVHVPGALSLAATLQSYVLRVTKNRVGKLFATLLRLR